MSQKYFTDVTISLSLRSSSPRQRIAALRGLRDDIRSRDSRLSGESHVSILFETYPLYDDSPSRREVRRSLQTVFDQSDTEFAGFVGRLQEISTPGRLSPNSLLVLVEWSSLALRCCAASQERWMKYGSRLCFIVASFLNSLHQSLARRSVISSAKASARRALRDIFRSSKVGVQSIPPLVQELSSRNGSGEAAVIFLGIVATVCYELRSSQPGGEDSYKWLHNSRKHLYDVWTREVLSSKTPVPAHVAAGFQDVWAFYLDEEDMRKEVLPPLEKALLRAPEVVLRDVSANMLTSFPSNIDLSEALSCSLLKPLLSGFKSTNPSIRKGALRLFTIAVKRCNETDSIFAEISRPLFTSKLTAVDQRILHAEALCAMQLSPASSEALCKGMIEVVGKEQNENALSSESAALVQHVEPLLNHGSKTLSAFLDVMVKGLGDKRHSIQRLWSLRCGDLLWQYVRARTTEDQVILLYGKLVAGLKRLYDDVVQNPIQSSQTGLVVSAYILIALDSLLMHNLPEIRQELGLKSLEICKRALTSEPKPSFLLNHRIYTKLATKEDLIWFLRALKSCGFDAVALPKNSSASEAWVHCYLWIVSSKPISHETRKQALEDISYHYRCSPHATSVHILRGLWSWFWLCENERKDAATSVITNPMDNLDLVIDCICMPVTDLEANIAPLSDDSSTQRVSESQLVDLLVLTQQNIIPKTNWIKTCLKAGHDPGKFVQKHSLECIKHVNGIINENDRRNPPSQRVYTAAYATLADLAFVGPDDFVKLLARQIQRDLDAQQLADFTPTDFAIAKTPAGNTFVDVLSGKPRELDKAAADYDTQRWEQDLRAQIAAKKGQTKKLTAEEQARVNQQLEKERAIREAVQQVQLRLLHGLGAVRGLVEGPPTRTELWLAPALPALLGIISAGVGLLLGNQAEELYIDCSRFLTTRLGSARNSIGVATVRGTGSVHVPLNLQEEPLGHLITRSLYRLRLAAEQRSFDLISLIYILPLISSVIRANGIGTPEQDLSDEQITLALEFLSFQGDTFTETILPRTTVLHDLINSMQNFPQQHRLVKDILNDVCRSIGSGATPTETQELLHGCVAPQASVRNAALQTIRDHMDLIHLDFSKEIWVARHEIDPDNVEIAREIWQENALEVISGDFLQLMPYLQSKDKALRHSTARALAGFVYLLEGELDAVLTELRTIYLEQNKPLTPQKDKYGLLKKTDLSDPWEARDGVALSFRELAQVFTDQQVPALMAFLIESGPLHDRVPSVRDEMIAAATANIAIHGSDVLEDLMSMFETTLNNSDKGSPDSDLVNEAVIILYGAVAQHLEESDPRVPPVVARLLQTLSTPSETVQYAVATCLPPLVRTSLDRVPEYFENLTNSLLQSDSYAQRRGAAYGIAGIVHGKGVLSLREYRIMGLLKSAVEDKKNFTKRQAAMMAYELLSLILGRTFEPYVIHVVPQLITGFGDPNADVREACLDASKTCFSTLSSYGVKVILPTLLEGLEEDQWRSKRGACDLLGAMAYLDPQQLASNLPEIIPPLTNVLNDTHKEVRAAANRSLQRFGEVISNPEVKSLVSVLLKALSDPTKHTDDALDALIKVNFVHYLDAPSLALVVRILGRGLGDRSATKRKAAQIIGSLAHLTEKRDLVAHLPVLVAGLRIASVDPVPTTRATASKALGSLVEKLGEDALPDLIPNLMSTLKADTGAGDRLGSAQALSEVLAGLGTDRLEETLPTILQNVSSNRANVREGFMSLFIFLPACFGSSFASYLNRIIPPILGGLADDIESIRDTALRAGRLIVKNFSTKAIDLLLPELDRGLSDDSHRIRLSSVELVGDLLFNLTGISAKQESEDDDDGAAEAGQSLLEVLGEDKRNKILSSLFICRNDTSGLVRSAAVNVWKALVASPRTLKELVPTLTQMLIKRLASSNTEQKMIAGNSLGELIRKSGEGVLSTLLPTLENGLQVSTDIDERQGICIALREVISSSSAESLEDFEKTLISVVRAALLDPDDEVRETAAEAFDTLQQMFGKRAVDQVLPHLLNLLRRGDEADAALGALLTLLTDNTRSNLILPNLMPTLMTSPISAFNARAIASLSRVAGDAFTRRIPAILNALMSSLIGCEDDTTQQELETSFDTILANVDEYDGLNSSMSVMLGMVKHEDHRRRKSANIRLTRFFEHSDTDFSRYNQDLVRVLLLSFEDRDIEVVKAAWDALARLIERLRKEELESLVSSTRQVLQQIGVSGSNLPGFCLPKGISPLLKLFTQGLMNGSMEQRVQAALGLSDIIDRTSVDGLKPFVTNITGPLIRVVSEKSTDLRSAILFTLNNLLEKVPMYLKPFLPQLQRTFAKSLSDPTSEILRNRAAKALGTLLNLKPRVDPLIAELVAGAKTPDNGVRTAMLKALFEVVNKAGNSMSEASRNTILGLIDSDLDEETDTAIITHARLLGTLIRVLPPEIANPLIKQRGLATRCTNASMLNLNAILLEAPAVILGTFLPETLHLLSQAVTHKDLSIAGNAVLAIGKYLLGGRDMLAFETTKPIVEALSVSVQPGKPNDIRRLGLVVIRTTARHHPDMLRPYLADLAPAVFANVRDMTIPVKLAAEAAFIAIFSAVDHDSTIFDKYLAGSELNSQQKRSMQDYFKRVTLRLASQARDRKEAEGGQGSLGLSSDEMEDEREVLSIGKVELTDVFSVIE